MTLTLRRSRRARRTIVTALALALTASFTMASVGAAHAQPGGGIRPAAVEDQAPGTFVSLEPARILDTRVGVGAIQAKVGASTNVNLQVTGRGGVPETGVAAVVVNVTVTGPSTAGFITVYPSGGGMPTASNLNFTPGQTIPNLVTVKVGDAGRINLTNNSPGSVDLIADVAGYYLAGTPTVPGAFASLDPARLLDTRQGIGAPRAAVGASGTVGLQITGRGGVPESGVAAVVMNVTVTGSTTAGFITVFPSGTSQPAASNLNFSAGQTIPNLVTVKVGTDGKVNLVNNSAGTAQLIADVAGYYLAGTATAPGAFVSLAPSRVLDTRIAVGAPQLPVAASDWRILQVAERGGLPSRGAAAVVLNVTVTNPQSSGFITVYPTGYYEPTASNLNFAAGQNIPNLAVVKVGGNGSVDLVNNSGGSVDLIADVAGYFIASADELSPIWPSGWIYDACGTAYDALLLRATPGIATNPIGAATSFEGENYYEILPGGNGNLVVTVSALTGYELINPDPTQWVSNVDGTLTGTFFFTSECLQARSAGPESAGPREFTPAAGVPLAAPPALGSIDGE